MKEYPRVLLLCSLSQNTANGITIGHLFRDWPSDRIAVAEFNDSIEDIYVPNISRYYIIGSREARFVKPFGYIKKMRASASYFLDEAPKEKQANRSNGGGLVTKLKAGIVALQSNFLHRSGLALVSRSFRVSKEFEDWLQDFKPDFIYCTGGDICKLEFLMRMKDHLGLPCAIHIFDDYINSKHEGTWFPKYWKERLDWTFRSVVNACDLHLAIGDKMAAEYTSKYGKPFHGFHNPIDEKVWLRAESEPVDGVSVVGVSGQVSGDRGQESGEIKSTTENRPPRTDHREPTTDFQFLYAGKVNHDTAWPIKRFYHAIRALNDKGYSLRLKLHSPYPYEEIYRFLGDVAEHVYAGKLPYAELPNAYREADALLLPMGFSAKTISFIRLSMLTKVSEYMISGTPIFCFAPPNIAASEYLEEHNAAFVCTAEEALEEDILSFIEDKAKRNEMAATATQRAREYHLMGSVCEHFRALISESSSR